MRKVTIVKKEAPVATKRTAKKTGVSIRDILKQVHVYNNEKLTDDQVDKLLSLELDDGKIATKPQLLVEIINLLKKHDFNTAMDNIIGATSKDVVLNLPSLEKERESLRLEFDALQSKLEVQEGLYSCSRCGSKNTRSLYKQIRGGDEGETLFVRCTNCGLQDRKGE